MGRAAQYAINPYLWMEVFSAAFGCLKMAEGCAEIDVFSYSIDSIKSLFGD